MRKYLFRLLTAFFFILFSYTGFTQQIDSMMGVYADRLAPEKIHIHFDKTIYNRGETVWYKIYILQGNGSDTAASSMNVYLEWYDADGKLITHTAAPILLATSQGSFDIPADYKGESLQVKAFTRWMLNDDPAFSYHRELSVNTNTAITTKPPPNKTTVAVFPESGLLIQGLNTRVAFKATNQYGNPVSIKGVLVDDTNHPIDSLKVQHDGMGSFYFIPLQGQTYKLNWIDEYGVEGSTPVSVMKTEGAHLTVKTSNGKAKFQVERTENVEENFKKIILLVHTHRVGLYQVDINATAKTIVNAEVPIQDLPTGLLQFTLFTSDWIPIAERVIFINNQSYKFDVKLTAPQINVDRKGKNTFDNSVPDTLFTNMSISITDAAVSPPDQYSIFSDILLSSEIKGKVYNPAYYLSSDADSVAAHLDLVMLTNGWRRFDWEKIRAHIPPKITYPVETSYMKIHGNVLGIKSNNSSAVINMIIVGKDSSKQLIFVPVAKGGSFEYPMVIFDTAKLFYNFNNNKSLTEKTELKIDNGLWKPTGQNIQPSNHVFVWEDKFAKQKLSALLAEQERLKKMMAEATLQEVIVTSKVKTSQQVLNDKYSSGFFARGNAYIFDLTDDTKTVFARDVLEYLQSKVPGLSISGTTVSWRGDTPDFFVNEMNADVSTITGYAMNDIAMVKLFPPIFMFSTGGGRGGAIAIYTKKGGDSKNNADVKGLASVVLNGYSQFREYYSPSYEQQSEEYMKPDNRSTLYWNPYLITNNKLQHMKIEFYNNDFTKTFNVVLEGMNEAGKMTRLVRTIDAKTKD